MANLKHSHATEASGVHGVSGTLVGTSDTQVLTNKTLTSPTLTGARITSKATTFSTVGAAAVTIESATIYITSAGVGIPTLAAPSSNDGVEITFISTTANA